MGPHAGSPPILINRPVTLIGSRSNARIHLLSRSVSKAHALLVISGDSAYIRDLASRSHVYVNDAQVRETDLADGDVLKIGSFTFKYTTGRRPLGKEAQRLPPGALEVPGEPMPVPVEERVVLIGRRSVSDIPLLEESVSTAHAVVFEMNGRRYLRDLGSRTGTFLNDTKIHQEELQAGDHIRIGETDIYYRPSQEAAEFELPSGSAAAVAEAPSEDEVDLGLDLALPADEAQADQVIEQPESGVEPDMPFEPPAEIEAEAPGEAEAPPQLELEAELAPPADIEPSIEPPPLPVDEESAIPLADGPEPAAPEQEPAIEQAVEQPTEETPVAAADEEAIDAALGLEPAAEDEVREPEVSSPAPQAAEDLHSDIDALSIETADQPEVLSADEFAPEESSSGAAIASEVEEQAVDELEADVVPPASAAVAREAEEPAEPAESLSPSADDDVVSTADHGGWSTHQREAPAEPPAAHAEASDAASEDSVFRFSDPVTHEPAELPGGEFSTEEAAAAAPGEEPRSDAEQELSDWGLAGHRQEPPAPRQPGDELEAVDFSRLQQEAHADDEAEIDDTLAPEEPEAPAESPLLDLAIDESPAPSQQIEEPEHRPLIAPDALAPDEPALAPQERAEAPAVEPEPERESLLAAEAHEQTLEPAAAEEISASAEAVTEPSLEQPAASDEPVEILDHTEATPESALGLEPVAEDEAQEQREALSDTGFSRDVSEFVGDSLGPIVEPLEEAPADQQAAEAVHHEEPDPAEMQDTAAVAEETAPAVDAQVEPLGEVIVAPTAAAEEQDEVTHLEPQSPASLEPIELSFDEYGDRAHTDVLAAPHGLVEEAVEEEVDQPQEAPPQPVAEAPPQPHEPQTQREPSAPPAFGFTWGPNQDHFLGGTPVNLGDPLPSAQIAGAPAELSPISEQRPRQPAAAPAPLRPRPVRPFADTSRPVFETSDAPPAEPTAPSERPASPGARRPRRATVIRNFGRSGSAEIAIPPFAGSENSTRGQITTAFDGLAMPPVREVDVFSQPSPPASDEPFSDSGAMTPMDLVEPEQDRVPRSEASEQGEPLPWEVPAASRRPRASRAVRGEDGGRPPVVQLPDEQLRQAELRRRSKLRRVPVLLAVMIILIVAATLLIWKFVPVSSIINASIAFNNFQSLTEAQRRDLRRDQEAMLRDDQTRRIALQKLAAVDQGVSAGFLSEPLQYPLTVENTSWPADARAGILLISYRANDPADVERFRAVLAAMHEQNRPMFEKVQETRRAIRELETRLASSGDEMRALKQRIDKERALVEQRPAPEQLRALETQLATLEKTYDERRDAVRHLERELNRLQDASETASSPEAPAAEEEDDAELQRMQQQRHALEQRIADARAAQEEQATLARSALDEAIGQFEQQIADARRGMQDDPELRAYIGAAETLLGDLRQLNSELIQTQQLHYSDLLSLKTELNELVEALRREAWQADAELRQLYEQKEIRTRQHNAAVAGKFTAEASTLKAELELIDNAIAARQERVAPSSRFSEVINGLEKKIDRQQLEITAARKRGDDRFREYQQRLAESQPSITKLPEEQKQLAQALETKLLAINDARARYAKTVDTINAHAEQSLRELQGRLTALQGEIDARTTQVAAAGQQGLAQQQLQQHEAELQTRQQELLAMRMQEAQARDAYFAQQRQLREAQTLIAEADMAVDRLAELNHSLQMLEAQRQQDQRQLESTTLAAQKLVEPAEPTAADVEELGRDDKRPIIAGASAAGIFLVFSAWIVLTVVGAMREMPLATMVPASEPAAADSDDVSSPSSHAPADEDAAPAAV